MATKHAGEKPRPKQPPKTEFKFPEKTLPWPDGLEKKVLFILQKYADCKCK